MGNALRPGQTGFALAQRLLRLLVQQTEGCRHPNCEQRQTAVGEHHPQGPTSRREEEAKNSKDGSEGGRGQRMLPARERQGDQHQCHIGNCARHPQRSQQVQQENSACEENGQHNRWAILLFLGALGGCYYNDSPDDQKSHGQQNPDEDEQVSGVYVLLGSQVGGCFFVGGGMEPL